MRLSALTLLATLAITLSQPARAADSLKAATPLGAEILIFEGALGPTALSPDWAGQRAAWARTVSESQSPRDLAAAVARIEQQMGWESVETAWKARRAGWVSEVQRAASMGEAAKLMLELEGNTRWSAVRDAWKKDRDGWARRVGAIGPAAPAAAAAAPRTPSVSGGSATAGASAEMKAFLAPFNGDYKAVKASLGAHGAAGLDDKDMDIMNLAEPKVTAAEVKGGRQCYTFEAKAGIMVRTYGVCWANGKIVAVEDKGMR